MLKLLGKWLNIYENEIGLFLWTVALLFLLRSSGILLNNYAETAFLKRFGVEYLPIVNMINAIATFFLMGLMAVMMGKIPGSRLLSYLFVFCGVSVAGIRLLIPLDIDIIYPVLFMLKSQYEVLLALLFWNLANDLFNTRQSKRLFPLITAGGVIGQILGSFGTPILAKTITFDNLLLAYLCTTLLGGVIVKRMSLRFPALLLSDQKAKKTKSGTSMIKEFKKIGPLLKESTLLKILIVLTFMPNVVIPIMNYQFNFAVNEQFATEGSMLQFFGYFRGFLNIISLIILMFVGRIYGRWGLPVALMFHPFNYIFAFLAFLFRFDVFSAMYARMSTNILRTTINIPSNAILMGLFPESYRAMVRPFLRGTVVRVGLFLGSGLILFSESIFHPRYLSLVALPFVAAWVIGPFILKRSYSKILLDLISGDTLDLKSMEEKDIGQLFNDKKIQDQLVQGFLSAHADDCLWYARLLKSISIENLDAHILTCIKNQDDKTRIGLLELLSPQAGKEAIQALKDMADPEKPDLMVAIIQATNRLSPEISTGFNMEIYLTSRDPEIRAYAVAALYNNEPSKYKKIINTWLDSDDMHERKAGIIAAMESQDVSYGSKLKEMLHAKKSNSLLPFILMGLDRLKVKDLNSLVLPYLSHALDSVRRAALEALDIDNDDSLRKIIYLMDDSSVKIQELARKKLNISSYQNTQVLIESLSIPRRKIRDGVFDLLTSQNVKDLDVYRYAKAQLEKGYINLAQVDALRLFTESRERNLLIDHLEQKRKIFLKNILRVLDTQDNSGRMRIIWREIFSENPRQRSNSVEALDNLMDSSLSKILMPLIEEAPISKRLAIGRKNFQIPDFDSNSSTLCSCLLAKKDWVTVILTLYMVVKEDFNTLDKGIVEKLKDSKNDQVREAAETIFDLQHLNTSEKEDHMETDISITEKILYLKKINLFEGLSVSELAAVASVTEEIVYPPGEIVINEGEAGETMFLIIKGEVSVIKTQEKGREMELDRIGAGDYFGEMAIFEDTLRSASIRTEKNSHLLVLHKLEFSEIVREYPHIALQICKKLSGRLRKLDNKCKY